MTMTEQAMNPNPVTLIHCGVDIAAVREDTRARRYSDPRVAYWLTNQVWQFRGEGVEGDALVVLTEGLSAHTVIRSGDDVRVFQGSVEAALRELDLTVERVVARK